MKKRIPLLSSLLICAAWLFPAMAFSAGAKFSATLPADASVVMDSMSGTLNVTVTNNSSSNLKIKFIRLEVNSLLYNFSSDNKTETASGWMIKELNNTFTATTAAIEFSAEKAWAELARGSSYTFSIILTGPALGPIAKDTADKTDTFVNIRAWEKGTAPPPGLYGDEAARTSSLPTWKRRGLKCEMFLAPDALPLGKTIRANLSVTNVSSAAQTGVVVQNFQKQGTGDATTATSFTPVTLSLASDETKIMEATFNSTRAGSLTMSAGAGNASVTAALAQSNEIYIGDFTAAAETYPTDVANGNQVTLTLAVTNNGTTSLHNITPSAPAFAGTATATKTSGPSPATLSLLAPGETFYFFTWKYTIAGSAGDDYAFSARATCTEGKTTNTAASNAGLVSVFAFSVTPTSINSGSLNKTFTFNIQNGGKAKVVLESVEIMHPSADFIFGSASGGYGGNWTVTALAESVRFTASGSSQYLPGGQQMDLTVTYAQTPAVASTTDYLFSALLNGSTNVSQFGVDNKFAFTENKSEKILVTNTVIKLEYSPAALSADGNAETTVTMTLLDGDTAMPGRPVDFHFVFTRTYETNPSWTYRESVTDQQGKAKARFRAPYNATNCSVIAEAQYGSSLNQIEIPFFGYDRPNLLYAGGLSPVQVNQDSTAQFSVKVKNSSSSYPMNLTASSYFTVTDAPVGGTSEYKAFLASPTSVPAGGALVTLTFQSKVFPATFYNGQFKPDLFLTDGNPANNQTRQVSDKLIVGSGSSGIRIIDWRIKR